MPRVLVFGSTGQLAQELARASWQDGTALTFLDRAAADLSQPERLGAVVDAHQPDIVILAAAYTKVDAAEDDADTAMAINGDAPGAIARAAAERSVPIVHVSTDYVFDGEKGAPYDEADAVDPVNVYGRSKLAGEAAIRAANPRHIILRTSWLYSAFGTNFLRTMLRLGETRDALSVVADQHGCPTDVRALAGAIAGIVPRLLAKDAGWGTYHLAGRSGTSWFGFAEAIFSASAKSGRRQPALKAIPTSAYPTKARRPRDSRLSSAAFEEEFGIRLRGFEEAVTEIVGEILSGASPSGGRS